MSNHIGFLTRKKKPQRYFVIQEICHALMQCNCNLEKISQSELKRKKVEVFLFTDNLTYSSAGFRNTF